MAAPGPGALVPAGSIPHGAPAQATGGTNQMVVPTNAVSADPQYVWCRLTVQGNAALWTLCFTNVQREVWRWPSYDFLVKVKRENGILVPVIRAEQVRFYRTRSLLLFYTDSYL